jgi:hypothetical protein
VPAVAVAGQCAAAGLLVIALRPPPRGGELHRRELAEAARREELTQPLRGIAEAVLEDDAQRDVRGLAQIHDALGGGGGPLDRLFGQDVLAGSGQKPDQRLARVGRGQDEGGVETRMTEQRVQIVGDG